MKRVMAVVAIGILTTLMLGVDQVSWAGQDRDATERAARRERTARRLAGLRPGATVEIERTDRTKINAVIQDIGPDAVTVLVEETGRGRRAAGAAPPVVTQTIAIDDIRSIKEVSVGGMSRTSKALIYAAVVAGVIVLVGACAASAGYA